MKRVLQILVVIGALFWFGARYASNHNNGAGIWDLVSSPTPTPGSTPSLTSPERTMAGVRTTLGNVEKKILMPLDAAGDYTDAEITQALDNSQQILGDNQSHADYRNLMQADELLIQAFNERKGFIERYKRETAKPASSSDLKSPDLGGGNSSSSFFKDAVVRDWNTRCNYYRSTVDRLLLPSS